MEAQLEVIPLYRKRSTGMIRSIVIPEQVKPESFHWNDPFHCHSWTDQTGKFPLEWSVPLSFLNRSNRKVSTGMVRSIIIPEQVKPESFHWNGPFHLSFLNRSNRKASTGMVRSIIIPEQVKPESFHWNGPFHLSFLNRSNQKYGETQSVPSLFKTN